jgi:hypothetical protein
MVTGFPGERPNNGCVVYKGQGPKSRRAAIGRAEELERIARFFAVRMRGKKCAIYICPAYLHTRRENGIQGFDI